MNPEITRIIEQYLSGELSPEDKIIFEERLSNSVDLQKELQLQQRIHEAAERFALRQEVSKVAKNYHFSNKLKWGGLGLGILTVLVSTALLIKSTSSKKDDFNLAEVKQLTDKLKENAPIDQLKSTFFAWNANDTAFLSAEGVLVSIPDNALLLNGKPYKKPAVIQWQEALDGASIVKAGLSTVSDGKLLETQGMFSFSAKTPEGKQLTINPKVGIYVQVPVDEYKNGMQLFDGEKEKDGSINWVKPRPLEKIPVPVSMSQLDFYPTDYEAKLNELKARKGKKYRDSLYLSFENDQFNTASQNEIVNDFKEPTKKEFKGRTRSGSWQDHINWSFYLEYAPNGEIFIHGKADLKEGWHVFSVDHDPLKADFTGIPTEFIFPSERDVQKTGKLRDGLEPKSMTDELGTSKYFERVAIFKQPIKITKKSCFQFTFSYSFQICDKNGCIFPPDQTASIWLNCNGPVQSDTIAQDCQIPPSSVLAFWKPKFDNTILATREFETRMKEIHRTCDKSVLDLYVKNLNKPMYELDEKVVKMGYPQFSQFAEQRVGALNANNPHVKGLEAFYDQAIEQLKRQEKSLRDLETNKRNKWDQQVSSERQKEVQRTVQRNNKAFNEEYNLNLKNVEDQLGSDLNHKNVRKQLGRVIGATIYGDSPICNIDRYVRETTLARKTNEYFDPISGKTARIQYNEFNFTVANAGKYKQLYAYLFPNQLNSYHRINGKDGAFTYPLNDAIIYDLAIVGISEEGYSYVQRLTLKGGELGEMQLDRVSEEKLDASIRQLNAKRGIKPFDVKDEIRWLKKEQKNYVEQKRRTDDQEFRNKIRPAVFPCSGESESSASKNQTIEIPEEFDK
jgi:hypothetical protein